MTNKFWIGLMAAISLLLGGFLWYKNYVQAKPSNGGATQRLDDLEVRDNPLNNNNPDGNVSSLEQARKAKSDKKKEKENELLEIVEDEN